MKIEEEENRIPDWLKNLQENSWELELLVSGGAIFSLFQLADLYTDWMMHLKIIALIPGLSVIYIIGILGIKILTWGFLLHLIMRAFWLGMVCLNYVFPKGINGAKIKLKKPYRTTHQSGDLKNLITRIDHICGIVMYMSIVSVAIIAGYCLLLSILLYFGGNLFSSFGDAFLDYYFALVIIIFLIYVFDLLSFGLLRKIKGLSYLTFPFFKLYDILSLRVLYNRALILFSTNINKINIYSIGLIFFTLSFISTYLSIYRTMHWPNVFDSREFKWQMADNTHVSINYYRDEFTEDATMGTSIQSKIISSNYLDLFVRYEASYDNVIHQATDKADSLKYFSDAVLISIDDSLIQNIKWYPKWHENIYEIGINAMIDISTLNRGEHQLKIQNRINSTDEEFLLHFGRNLIIPFWKDF